MGKEKGERFSSNQNVKSLIQNRWCMCVSRGEGMEQGKEEREIFGHKYFLYKKEFNASGTAQTQVLMKNTGFFPLKNLR